MYHRSLRRAGFVFLMCFVLLGLLVPATVSAAPAQPDKQSTAAQEGYGGFYYTVRPGDNLTRIASRYGTTVGAIMSANGLYSSVIYVGQVLYIPAGHGGGGGGGGGALRPTSCSQETPYPALPAGSASAPSSWRLQNNIDNPSHIYVGQRLCIPSGGGHPYPPPPPPPPPGPSCGQYYTVRPGDTLECNCPLLRHDGAEYREPERDLEPQPHLRRAGAAPLVGARQLN